MNDLLGSVRGSNPTYARKDDGFEHDSDLEEGPPGPPPSEAEQAMQRFFAAVEGIKMDMAQIRALQREVNEMHEQGKTIVKSDAVKKHQRLMQDKVDEVNVLATKVKRKVEDLDKDNEKARANKATGPGSANERTRTTITAGLKKKLKELMGDFSDLRNRINEEYREVVERRLKTIKGTDVTEDEVDHVIETGQAEDLFQTALQEQGRGRVLDVLAEIQERNKAVKDLEQSLLELHQIFLDMAVLVEAQGEMLDNIQKQVERATNYVKGGTEALVDAKQLQKNTRKWMCCAIITLLVVALIIVLAVVQPWKFTR